MSASPDGWDIGSFEQIDWVPWGAGGNARAKVLGSADGYYMALVEAEPGYRGDPHEHSHAEFLYVVSGRLHSEGREMVAGDGYAAAPGSAHREFGTDAGATYLSIFRL
jgi:quercetin dioxygenase-like cupin family protein